MTETLEQQVADLKREVARLQKWMTNQTGDLGSMIGKEARTSVERDKLIEIIIDNAKKELRDEILALKVLAANFDMMLKERADLHDRQIFEAFERLKHLELHLFPNLAKDIEETYKLIGQSDGDVLNPLDRRKK